MLLLWLISFKQWHCDYFPSSSSSLLLPSSSRGRFGFITTSYLWFGFFSFFFRKHSFFVLLLVCRCFWFCDLFTTALSLRNKHLLDTVTCCCCFCSSMLWKKDKGTMTIWLLYKKYEGIFGYRKSAKKKWVLEGLFIFSIVVVVVVTMHVIFIFLNRMNQFHEVCPFLPIRKKSLYWRMARRTDAQEKWILLRVCSPSLAVAAVSGNLHCFFAFHPWLSIENREVGSATTGTAPKSAVTQRHSTKSHKAIYSTVNDRPSFSYQERPDQTRLLLL